MRISDQVLTILELLGDYSAHRIADPDTLARLLQHAGDMRKQADLGELSFRAKHLCRIIDTMAKQTADTELHLKLQEECSISVREFHQLLGAFVADAPAQFREMIGRHYLDITPEALAHLLKFAHDLEWLKNWELDMTQHNVNP